MDGNRSTKKIHSMQYIRKRVLEPCIDVTCRAPIQIDPFFLYIKQLDLVISQRELHLT